MRGMLAGKRQMQAVCQSRETRMQLPSAWREKKIMPDLQSMHVCCNESNVAVKWRRRINLLGGEKTNKHTWPGSNDEWSLDLPMDECHWHQRKGKKKKKNQDLWVFCIFVDYDRTSLVCDAAGCWLLPNRQKLALKKEKGLKCQSIKSPKTNNTDTIILFKLFLD